MEIYSDMERAPYAVRAAILVHGGQSHVQGGKAKGGFATIHDVSQGPGQRPVIEAGRLLGTAELEEVLAALNPARGLQFIPDSLLASSSAALVWWRRPGPERVWFKTHAEDALQDRTGIVPHPALVFAATMGGWFVWAVKGAERPSLDTALYQAPYLNTYEDGSLCQGNVVLPKTLDASVTIEFERAFFGSRFTHANVHGKNRLVKWRGGAIALWDSLLKRRRRLFPEHALVPLTGITLGSVISALSKGETLAGRAG
ncbi:PRTRC system protein B [Ottowia sp.]|uniref:PRTRC system protein B n=1 Tax=Ottowia sp. TaxID=1898956 RepID=UPI0025F4602B|nr:PRTRC system protein B [Ottowia sp.]MBK6616372.1 PRTRC system protein B [Ottowia sp.]